MGSRATTHKTSKHERWQASVCLCGLLMLLGALCFWPGTALGQDLGASDETSQEFLQRDPIQAYQAAHPDEDLTPPRLSALPLIIQQADEPVNLLSGVTAFDDRDDDVAVTVVGYDEPTRVAATSFKAGISYLTYQAQDQAGNVGYLTRAVLVTYRHPLMAGQTDFVAPEVKSTPVYLVAGSQSLDAFIRAKDQLVAYDQVDGDVSQRFYYLTRENQDVDLNQPGRYRIRWEVQDRSHNRAIVEQWVVVVAPQPED